MTTSQRHVIIAGVSELGNDIAEELGPVAGSAAAGRTRAGEGRC